MLGLLVEYKEPIVYVLVALVALVLVARLVMYMHYIKQPRMIRFYDQGRYQQLTADVEQFSDRYKCSLLLEVTVPFRKRRIDDKYLMRVFKQFQEVHPEFSPVERFPSRDLRMLRLPEPWTIGVFVRKQTGNTNG